MADEPLGCAEKRGVEGGLAGCVDCVGLHWHGGIVPVLCPHNKREENVAIKAGEVPGDWENKPSKHSRKDLDARWSEEDQKTVRGGC